MSMKNRCGGKRCGHMERLYVEGAKACTIKGQGKAGMCPCGICLVRAACTIACKPRFEAWDKAVGYGKPYRNNKIRFRRRRDDGEYHKRTWGKGTRFRL